MGRDPRRGLQRVICDPSAAARSGSRASDTDHAWAAGCDDCTLFGCVCGNRSTYVL